MLNWREIEIPSYHEPEDEILWIEPARAQDYYAELSIPRNATSAQIKQAYRKMALRYHPDLNREVSQAAAEDRMMRLNAAYGVLSSPERRHAYDRSLR